MTAIRQMSLFGVEARPATPLDLEGLILAAAHTDGSSEKSHVIHEGLTIEPDDYLVVGDATADAMPSYLDYAYGNDITLGNSDGGKEYEDFLNTGEVTFTGPRSFFALALRAGEVFRVEGEVGE